MTFLRHYLCRTKFQQAEIFIRIFLGREIISNLAKAAGLNTMITTMRPDIDHSDEFVRNTTARAFAVVWCSSSNSDISRGVARREAAGRQQWRQQ